MGIPFPLTLNSLQGQPELANGLLRQNYPPSACGSFPLILNLLTDCRNRVTRSLRTAVSRSS